MSAASSRPPSHAFADLKLVGCAPCLDFANTVDGTQDWLSTYPSLAWWAHSAGLVSHAEACRLVDEADRRPQEAAAVLRRARRLRRLLRRVFGALTSGELPSRGDIDGLNRELAGSLARLRIVRRDAGFALDFPDSERGLDNVLRIIVRSAAELLASRSVERVSQCDAPDCDWLFLDESRNHSRRWCDMSSCGNRAKARRHYARRRSDA